MSLYRTYRPQTFADIIGQDHIVTTLENAANKGQLAHAYLFSGSRGTGKTSTARILSKVLMIQGITDETLQNQIIKNIEEGSIVDLMEIDAASNRGIDDIRNLIEKIQFSPVVAAAKVYIVDEAHMLTKEAFNALLKTLEEPPSYAYFILATTEINKIPSTILSRCQCFSFHRIREEDIVRRLQYIVDTEHIEIDREALRRIAHHVEGGMRDAISLLDQLRSLPKITVEDVEKRIGGTSTEQVEIIFQALNDKNDLKIVEAVRSAEESGIPHEVLVRELLGHARSHLHTLAESGGDVSSVLPLLNALLSALIEIRKAPLPGLALEAALLRLTCTTTPKIEAKKQEPKEEKKSPVVPDTPPEESQKDSPELQPVDPATLEAPELSLNTVKEAWPAIVKSVSPASVKMSLQDGTVTDCSDDAITVSFSSDFHKAKVATPDASIAVEEAIKNVFKRTIKLQCTVQSDTEKDAGADQESVNLAEAAAELF